MANKGCMAGIETGWLHTSGERTEGREKEGRINHSLLPRT